MLQTLVTASALIIAGLITAPVFAQKSGGVLKVHHEDSPATMSIMEDATHSTVVPMMGVFNNLVMYKQDKSAIASRP
jgi:peptide/nickel transport system substrate-binding protein